MTDSITSDIKSCRMNLITIFQNLDLDRDLFRKNEFHFHLPIVLKKVFTLRPQNLLKIRMIEKIIIPINMLIMKNKEYLNILHNIQKNIIQKINSKS